MGQGTFWCHRCGNRNPAGSQACQRCGARLRPPKALHKETKKGVRLASREGAPPPSVSTTRFAAEEPLPLDTIICGDCLEILPRWPSESIDLVITSPPYNFGLDAYDAHRDTQDWATYFATLGTAFRECARLLKPGGRICVVVQPLFSDYMPTHHRVARLLEEAGLLFYGEILWEKHNYNAKYTAWGSWRSPSMPYLKYTWEFIEVFAKGSRRKPGRRDAIDITAEEFKAWVTARWEIPPETRMKGFGHPSMFPERLVERLVKLFSYRGDVVLDPFNGAGTTTLVAYRLGRHFIGIDVSERYCQVARARLAQVAQAPNTGAPLVVK
ncbi:Modification methylase DpnIIB [bacterium HR23]|nr:Modification methylase DpnIIB [bacterium HR23]